MAITSCPTLSASEWPIGGARQARGIDLDDGQVGERVDAVDAALEDAAVLELDIELLAALDDVVIGQDPAVAVEDDARPDAGRRDDPEVAGIGGAGDADLHDGRADRRRDRDRRRRFIDGDRLHCAGVGGGRRGRRGGRSIEGADGVEGEDRATRCQDRGQERGRDKRPAASPLATRGRGRRGGGRRRRGLVPALGRDGRDLVPGSSPVGARFRGRRVAVAAGLRGGRGRGPRPRRRVPAAAGVGDGSNAAPDGSTGALGTAGSTGGTA